MKQLSTLVSGALLCVLTASGGSAMPMLTFTSNWVVTTDRTQLAGATAKAAFGKDAMAHGEVKNTNLNRFVV